MRPIGNQCIGVFPPLSQKLLIRCSNLITNHVSEFECLLKRQERINDSVSRSPLFLLCLRSEAVGECPVLTRAAHGIYHQSYAQNYEWDAEHLSEIHAVVRNHFIFGADLHVFQILDKESGHEDADEEDTGDELRTFLSVALPVHPHQQSEE